MKTFLHICFGIVLTVATVQAQNIGIDEPAPDSKLDIVQTETTGNTIEVNHSIAANASSAVLIRNSGAGIGLHVQNLISTNSLPVAQFEQNGVGRGILINHSGVSGLNAEFTTDSSFNTDEVIRAEHSGRGSAIIGFNNSTTSITGKINIAQFEYLGSDLDDHIGVLAASVPQDGWGIGVQGNGGWIGVIGAETSNSSFAGVQAIGDLAATGTKPFIIDHPIDPENKYLRHFALESNEVLNMYRGVTILDASGEAIIELPAYFEAINKDYSYQLTAIGTPQQPYIAKEIENGQFTVAGAPNTKVSWMVLAERNDAYVQQRPDKLRVEFDKKEEHRGKYLMPDLFGQSPEKGIFYTPRLGTKEPSEMKLSSERSRSTANYNKELERIIAQEKYDVEIVGTSKEND